VRSRKERWDATAWCFLAGNAKRKEKAKAQGCAIMHARMYADAAYRFDFLFPPRDDVVSSRSLPVEEIQKVHDSGYESIVIHTVVALCSII